MISQFVLMMAIMSQNKLILNTILSVMIKIALIGNQTLNHVSHGNIA